MRVTCPHCRKVLTAPDKLAGRKVKCPKCRKSIALPTTAAHDEPSLDLGALDQIESAGEVVAFQRPAKLMTLKEAQAAAAAVLPPEERAAQADPRIRTCPRCGQKIKSDDIYSELMCKHCGGLVPGQDVIVAKAKYTSSMAGRMLAPVTFYTGFSTAALYPLGAIDSVLKAMGIALAAIAVPLLGVLAFTQSSALNPINSRGEAVGPESAAWVAIFLTVAFLAEAVYFGSVAYYALIDTIRTTTAGSEKTATLTWNVLNLGAALGGYAALIVFYAIIFLAMYGVPTSLQELEATSSPWKLGVVAILTFGVPMNIIGLASSHALDGLNPMRVFPSILHVLGHYVFLFLIVLLYLALYVGAMYAAMSWAGPMIMDAAQKGLQAGFLKMLAGIGAWAVVMGLGFYFAYSLGRVLGLFSRSYREHLKFEL